MPALCSTYMVWPCWLSICTPEGVNPTLYSKIRRSLGMPIFIFPSCENPVIRVNLDQINRAEYPRLWVFRPDRWLGLKQDFPVAWNSPVQCFPVDNQRWRKADHVLVRLFGQDAFLLQRLTEAACSSGLGFQLDADQQALAAHLLMWGLGISASWSIRYSPILTAFSIRFSSTITRSAARATAAPSGLPPKVEPCSPGRNSPSTSRSASTAETG